MYIQFVYFYESTRPVSLPVLHFIFTLIRYTGGMTATGTALQYVRNSLIFNAAAGARSGVKKVIYVLTDGRSNRGISPGIPAGQLKSAGVTIFAMGVTNSIRTSELLAIATSPHHIFHVANYAVLNRVTQAIRSGKLVSDFSLTSLVENFFLEEAKVQFLQNT